ncbi:hypothetical protein [Flavobacterium oreochromis]|uniref:Uncharacterized protein n=1 Tax=Flavobacterium columnare TaxID=996 RepID=A0A246GCP4_9FLAO|nr:hypothetical protein [Flavobacterium oreochromis]OWP78791.1 hypothetical protein BWG23_01515 [Flavobacterium oreochromis]OWP78880.1 hypothetical protein BWK62_03705 [Flavobacterium oreochromis]
MSRTRIVGGNLIKITGGTYRIFAKKGIEFHSNGKIIMNAEGGTVYGEPESPPVIQANITLPAKCIVQFRPKNGWKGEFGFDWFRLGDTGIKGDVDYNTIVGQYYNLPVTNPNTRINRNGNAWTTNFERDPQPAAFAQHNRLQQLKRLYGIEYFQLTDDKGVLQTKEYYKPVIALFAQQRDPNKPKKFIETGKAELQLYLQFDYQNGKAVKPKKILFEANGVLLDSNNPDIEIDKPTIEEKDINEKIEIELTCKTEFQADKTVEVYAISNDAAGNEIKLLAGVLKVIAPSKKVTKNILIVKVKNSEGTGKKQSLDLLKKITRQALINLIITEKHIDANGNDKDIKIDLSNPQLNMAHWDFDTICNVDATKTPRNILRTDDLDTMLLDNFNRDFGNQFANHFILFFLPNTNITGVINNGGDDGDQGTGNAGFSVLNSGYGVMYSNHTDKTIAHETLHGLGLPHSFFGQHYVYQAQKTENIMDYSHSPVDLATNTIRPEKDLIERISTWFWQWNIINPSTR